MKFTLTQTSELLAAAAPGSTVYLVGVGGCGMSGLGHLLLDLGHRVVGSDLKAGPEIEQLRERGAHIFIGHTAAQVKAAQPILLVHTSAVHGDNPELQAAEEMGLPVARRGVVLASLVQRQRGICVAGMHGKTTTSALLAYALDKLRAHPSYAIGWQVPQFERHARFAHNRVDFLQQSLAAQAASARGRWDLPPPKPAEPQPAGGRNWFVVEADESDGTLHEFHPEHAIILNVDNEHLDHYADIGAACREFWQFASQTTGDLVYCADDPRLSGPFARHPRGVTFGFHPTAEYRVTSVRQEQASHTSFEMWQHGRKLGPFSIRLLGEKNVSNAAAVIALLHRMGYSAVEIAGAIESFRGAARRQQELYQDESYRVFDDYGHHPSEIRATLNAMRHLGARRVLVAFQPHRYTRTCHLMDEFATCFAGADRLWLADIYPASEPAIPGVNSERLAHAIRARGQDAEYVESFAELRSKVRAAMRPGDLALFLGAGGDITQVAHEVAEDLRFGSHMAHRQVAHAAASAAAAPASTNVKPEECLASPA